MKPTRQWSTLSGPLEVLNTLITLFGRHLDGEAIWLSDVNAHLGRREGGDRFEVVTE